MIKLKEVVSKHSYGCTTIYADFKAGNLSHSPTIKVDRFRIPAPAGYVIIATMKSNLFYFAAIERHYKYITISILSSCECNPFAIRRNTRAGFIPLHCSQPCSLPVLCRSFPKVTFKTENDRLSVGT